MKMSKKSNKNLFEFLRYAIVGGIAALVDMGVLALFKDVVFFPELFNLFLSLNKVQLFVNLFVHEDQSFLIL